MPPKSKGKASAAPRAADAYEARAQCLCRLQDTVDDWWDGVEVNVPWAAAGAAYAQRADLWLGIITEAIEEDNALDSQFTIEDPGDPDDAVVVTGAQLAGIEGFGKHDARICAFDNPLQIGQLVDLELAVPIAAYHAICTAEQGTKHVSSGARAGRSGRGSQEVSTMMCWGDGGMAYRCRGRSRPAPLAVAA